MFDDSLLDDPVALAVRGQQLQRLALTGARLRYEPPGEVADVAAGLGEIRPRCVVVIGAEARLVRAVAEPSSPIPLVAWPSATLPAWTGPLDLVVVLAGADDRLLPSCLEALRRGALLLVVAPRGSPLLDEFGPASALVTRDDDPLVSALLALKMLDLLHLAPSLDLGVVADVFDAAAEECGPRHELGSNPAKDLACALADGIPLVCGGSALAARAARRLAEAIREATGVPALAADEEALRPLVIRSRPRDVFADPFEDAPGMGFCLLVLEDGQASSRQSDLTALAASRNVRVETISCTRGSPVVRYVGLLHRGLFAAAYLGLATIEG